METMELVAKIEAFDDMSDVLAFNRTVSLSNAPETKKKALYVALEKRANELQVVDAMIVPSELKVGEI